MIEYLKRMWLKFKIRRFYKNLNWTAVEVWEKTRFCGCLEDAIDKLASDLIVCFERVEYHSESILIDNSDIRTFTKGLIRSDYENGKF